MPPAAATQAAIWLWTASCLLQLPLTVSDAVCGIQNARKQCISRYHLHTANQFFHPSPYTILQWAYIWRPGWPIVGTTTSHPSPRETIVQEIANFTWRMRRSSLMLEINELVYSKFKGTYSKRQGNSSCRNLRYASPVRRPSQMKGPINQIIVQNCTTQIDTQT